MKLEEVTKAAEQGAVVPHTHMGITSRCRISGVITPARRQLDVLPGAYGRKIRLA